MVSEEGESCLWWCEKVVGRGSLKARSLLAVKFKVAKLLLYKGYSFVVCCKGDVNRV